MAPVNVGTLLALLLLVGLPGPAWGGAYGDGPALDLIDQLKPIAESISVDGDPNDWAGIPHFRDPNADGNGNSALEIVNAAIAPLDDAWLIKLEAAGSIPVSGLSYRFRIDYRSQRQRDLEIGINPTFTDSMCWWHPDQSFGGCNSFDPNVTPLNFPVAIAGNVMEVRIPHSTLAAELPTSFSDDLSGSGARSWVRIIPFSEFFDPNQSQTVIADYGPAVGSFRLLATPYTLDPPLPVPDPNDTPDPAIAVSVPLEGIQFIDQGAGGVFSHAGYWGYDLFRTDNALNFSDPPGSGDNADYFSFGDKLYAPAPGKFWSSSDGMVDENPGCTPFDPNTAFGANFLFMTLDGDPNAGILFTHMRQGTVEPLGPFGSAIPEGTLLGEVGNSGSCADAHLHLGAETIELPGPFPSRPMEFSEVEVGLNPQGDDPWLRRLASWGIREGFFVRQAGALCGDVNLDQVLDASDSSALQNFLADAAANPLGAEGEARCSVIGTAGPCSILDWVVLAREISGLLPGVAQVCNAAVGS